MYFMLNIEKYIMRVTLLDSRCIQSAVLLQNTGIKNDSAVSRHVCKLHLRQEIALLNEKSSQKLSKNRAEKCDKAVRYSVSGCVKPNLNIVNFKNIRYK